MIQDFKYICAPAQSPVALSADQALQGPQFPPQQQILLYSADQWEEFVHEWVHFCLKERYAQVQRFSGAGDRGIDILGFADSQKLKGKWDNYQCKHYNHPLRPSDIWPEFGKILWYTFKNEFKPPQHYYFIAPRGVGTTLAGFLADAEKLKEELIKNWEKNCSSKITDVSKITLEEDFKAYVEKFDFSIFESKTTMEILEAHKQQCPSHVARFGGGLPERPPSEVPPAEIGPRESRYVEQLLNAYAEHMRKPVKDIGCLSTNSKLRDHFQRQRIAFYHAESLRVFARDSTPSGTFDSFQENIYVGVIDTHDAPHPDGYMRVCAVTKAARDLQLTSNALIMRAEPIDRDGICHQLANEDRLQWISS